MVAVLEVVAIFGRLGVPKLELGASREMVASWSMRALAIHNQPLILDEAQKNNHSRMLSVHEGNLTLILILVIIV